MELHDASQLITIGEFARLGGVSIKALRIYAEIGLLQPAYINPRSRYRLYSKSQISRLHRILMLKNAGLSLAQIGGQVSHRDEAALSKLRASLISRAEEIQQQLAWLEAEIRAARNRTSAAAAVVIKHAPEMRILSQRRKIHAYEDADGMLRDLGRSAPKATRFVAGAIWHDCGTKTGIIDCEVFWVLNRDLRAGAMKTLTGAAMASILHEGDESTIGESYQAARRWVIDNRYEIAGPNREIYLGGSGTEPSMALIEVQFPVRKRS